MAVSPATLELLRKLTDREHDLFNTRTSTFLLWESILMAAYSWSRSTQVLGSIIPIMGICATCLWAYVARRTLLMQSYYREQVFRYEKDLPSDEERVYTNGRYWRRHVNRPLLGITTSQYFAYGFPTLWVCAWISIPVLRLLGK